MASDSEWVEDVKRWYFAGRVAPSGPAAGAFAGEDFIGYEAADPALQSRHWPDAPAIESAGRGD